jgi:hypothetical protein
LKNDSEGIY